MPKKLSNEEFHNRIAQRDDIILLTEDYPENYLANITIKCKKCGYIWDSKVGNVIGYPENKRVHCPKCANEIRKAHLNQPKVNYLNDLLNNRPDGKDYKWLSKDYDKDNKRKLILKHKLCGKVFMIRPNDFQQGYGCPFCNGNNSNYKNTSVYIKILYSNEEKFIKIGLDSNSRRHFKGYHHSNIFSSVKTNKEIARKIERFLLEEYHDEKYIPKIKFDGFTECFKYSESLIEQIKKDVETITKRKVAVQKTPLIAGTSRRSSTPIR